VVPPLVPPYLGPFTSLDRGQKTFVLQMGDRRVVVSIDRLKPHLGSPPVPAQPPRRGCPPTHPISSISAASPSAAICGNAAGGGPCSDRKNAPK
jgi:hypothetical protein